jgi:acyl dehydratase
MPLLIEQAADLPPLVGQDLPPSAWLHVAQSRIDLFGEATGDQQWIHCDPRRAARESPYGAPIAHGFLTLSLVPGLLEEIIRFPGGRMVINYGLNRVRFPQAVPVDSQIRLVVRIQSSAARDDSTELVCQCTIEIDGQTKPACVAELLLRIYF